MNADWVYWLAFGLVAVSALLTLYFAWVPYINDDDVEF